MTPSERFTHELRTMPLDRLAAAYGALVGLKYEAFNSRWVMSTRAQAGNMVADRWCAGERY